MHELATAPDDGKEGRMNQPYLVLIAIILAVLLASCRDETVADPPKRSAEEMRIENEVKRRVAATGLELEHEANETQMQTLRIIAFVMLSSASVAGLIFLRQDRRRTDSNPPAVWNDHYPPGTRRSLDLSQAGIPPNPAPHSHHETPRRP